MSRRRVRHGLPRCSECGREKFMHSDACTNPDCPRYDKRRMASRVKQHMVRIDTPGGTNRERPHTAMALAFARALARGEPMVDQRGVKAFNEAEERAREALRAHGGDWHNLPRQSTTDWYLALRARAIQAEDALAALKDNPGYVEANERESLLEQIAQLTATVEEDARVLQQYQHLLQDYEALRNKVADYQDMPDPQETRRRMDVLSKELHDVQETLAVSQQKLSDALAEKARAQDLIQNLRRDQASSGRFTDEQVLELLMPLARRVHGLESKLFEQAGIFP